MRKIKLTVEYRVPSWNFCNIDTVTAAGTVSKTKCRFCVTTKQGSHCSLYDEDLLADSTFTHKTKKCINATAGFQVTADEPTTPVVDPRLIIRETLNSYKKAVEDLVKQGYPRNMAETIATKYILEEQ